MVFTSRAVGTHPAMVLGLGLVLYSLTGGITRADEPQPAPVKPLRLTLTEAELLTIIARHQTGMGHAVDGQLEEIMVTAPVGLPMRDVTQEVWGGIAAPLWALTHPAQAWRIFLPIPPK